MSYPIKLNNCYTPISKPESEMTDEEKEQMRQFEITKQYHRISDRLYWGVQLKKMQIRVYDDFINKK